MSELLRPECVVVGLKGDSYVEAISTLLDRLETIGRIEDREELDALVEAEAKPGDASSIGDRALLVHLRTDAVRELSVALGIGDEAFSFAPPGAPEARILILVVIPRSAARYYLKVIAALTGTLRESSVVEAILEAATAEEAVSAARLHDLVIQPQLVVGDLMSREVQTAAPDTPLSEVMRLMVRYQRRAIPVVSDSGEVLGLVTERELLEHFLPQLSGSAGLDADERPSLTDVEVRQVMQRSVLCLSEDQLISDVVGIMISKDVARFPVVRAGKLVGFLSRTDLIRKLLEPSI